MISKNEAKKIFNLFRYRFSRPLLYSIFASVFIYLFISNIIIRKELKDLDKPHFTISSINKVFSNVEYMHLLLTIQEIINNTPYENDLIKFVNSSFPNPCPPKLKKQLYLMNWEDQAFLIRVKKMFELLEIYDRVNRIDEDIALLEEEEVINFQDYKILQPQINILLNNKKEILSSQITSMEYEFIKEYAGIVIKLKK